MWVCNFFIAGSLTMILPFLPLYIETFGHFSDTFVQHWAGLVFGVSFVSGFIFSPIWGRFGDKHGRKKVLVILGYGLALSVFFMGYVQSVYLLFILRFFMGVFAGFISTSQALISAQTPRKIAGRVLGTLQTGNVSGSLCGPLIGGYLADSVGFQSTFLLTAITASMIATIVLVGIQEIRVEEEKSQKHFSSKEVFHYIVTSPVLFMVMIISTIIQIANFIIQPLLALYVSELHGPENLALLSGVVFSAAGLGNLMFTRKWGNIGDRIGYEKIMIILMVLSAIAYFPQAFVTNIWQLAFLRFILGIVLGGLIPCRTAYIRVIAPLSIQGEVLGYNASFRFLGNVIGPMMGGFISGYIGISSVFFVTSALLLIAAGLLWAAVHKKSPQTAH